MGYIAAAWTGDPGEVLCARSEEGAAAGTGTEPGLPSLGPVLFGLRTHWGGREKEVVPGEGNTFVSGEAQNPSTGLTGWPRLLHLAVIHEAPTVLLCCLALLPQEVLDIQNDLFQTALHLAVYLDQPLTVQALVQKGASRTLQDRHGDTALHLACQHQHLDCARYLLEVTSERGRSQHHHPELRLQNWQGLACLHLATLQRNRQLMELLLQNGADIDIQEGTSGKTALHLAVETQDRALVRFLLRAGAQVDARMHNGCTPLHLAAGRHLSGIAATLCQAGADSLLRNVEDETPQDLAEDPLTLLPFDDLKISGKPLLCTD
ncbi:NF-kappa-B inhibitor epsilon isoform X3 [Sminthopsis crassicaudata]|uniref:NF-kappa-B inhibitor epsilon isoform X3 n=1 Tax=Sminthopsis crassicaudata TaxID=9301 RepID=UPI003D68708F